MGPHRIDVSSSFNLSILLSRYLKNVLIDEDYAIIPILSLPFPRQSVCDEYLHLVLHVNTLSFVKIMEMGQCSVVNYERLLQLRSAES